MKTKLNLYVTNVDAFLRGDYHWCFHLSDSADIKLDGYFLIGSPTIDVDVDVKELTQYALDVIEKTEKETRAEFEVKMGLLKEKKANLLSITHQPLEVV